MLRTNPALALMRKWRCNGEAVLAFQQIDWIEFNFYMTNESITTILYDLERELHNARRNSDQARVAELIHADFLEFGRSGRRYNRAEILHFLVSTIFSHGGIKLIKYDKIEKIEVFEWWIQSLILG